MKLKFIAVAFALTFGASSAFAASYTVGGSPNGTSTISGPTIVTLTTGASLACTSSFTVSVTSGVAKVTAASFSGASGCSSTHANSLPWTISPPSGPSSVAITGVSVTVGPPVNTTCGGTVNGSLSGGSFSFSNQLNAPCRASSNPSLGSSPTLAVVYP